MDINNDPLARLEAAKERLKAKQAQQQTSSSPTPSADPENPLAKYYNPKAKAQPSGGSMIPLVTPQAANPAPKTVPQPRFAKPEKGFFENVKDGIAVGWEQMKGTTARGIAEMVDLGATTPLGVPYNPLAEGQPKFGDYSKLKRDQAEGKRGPTTPGLVDFADKSQKKAETMLAERKADPESWGYLLGSLVPQGAGIATGVAVGAVNPPLGMAIGVGSTAQLTGMAIGGAAEEYDTYVKETGQEYDPNARLGTMMLTAAAESISEAIPVAKFIPKGYRGKMAKFIFGNTEVQSKLGSELIQEFAKSSKSRAQLVKNLTREAVEGALTEGPTEAFAELGSEFSTWLYKEKEDRATFLEMAERAGKAVVGGSIMGGAIGPLSYGAQQVQNQRRRKESGKVVLAQDKNTGEALEIMGVANPSKKEEGTSVGPAVYQAIRPNGKIIEIDENNVGTIIELPLEDFNGILSGKGKAMQDQQLAKVSEATQQAQSASDEARAQFEPLTYQGPDGSQMISGAKYNGEDVFITQVFPDGTAVIQKPGADKQVVKQDGLTEMDTRPFEEFISTFAPPPAQTGPIVPLQPIQIGEPVTIEGSNYVVTGINEEEGIVQLENEEDGSDLPSLPLDQFNQLRELSKAQQPVLAGEEAAMQADPAEESPAEQLRKIFTEGDQVDLGGKTEIEEAKSLPKATEQTAKQYEDIKTLVDKKLGVKFNFATVGLQKELRLNDMKEALKQAGEIGQELADIIDFPSAALRFLNNLPDATPTRAINPQSPDLPAQQNQPDLGGAQPAITPDAPKEPLGEGIDNQVQVGEPVNNPNKLEDDGITLEQQFELNPAKNTQDIDNNINEVLSQYSGKTMGKVQVFRYLTELGELGKQWAKEKGISSKEDLDKWAEKAQNKARAGKGKERKETKKLIDQQKAEFNVSEIEKMALQAENDFLNQPQSVTDDTPSEANQESKLRIEAKNEFDKISGVKTSIVGSTARGEAKQDSDIDIILEGMPIQGKEKLNEDERSQNSEYAYDTLVELAKQGIITEFELLRNGFGLSFKFNGYKFQVVPNPTPQKGKPIINQPKTNEAQQLQPSGQDGQENVQEVKNQENSTQKGEGQEGVLQGGVTPSQYEDVEKASTAEELAELYDAEVQNMEGVDPIDAAIADHIGKINPESFARFGDRNNISKGLAGNWIAKKGTGKKVDLIAKDASEQFTPGNSESISTQDVIDFINKYNNSSEVTTPKGNPKLKAINDKHIALTGKGLNRATALAKAKELRKQIQALQKKSVNKADDGKLLETDEQIAEYLANNPDILDFLQVSFGKPGESIWESGEINWKAALNMLETNPGFFTSFPGSFTALELDKIRTILNSKINEQAASNTTADSTVQADPKPEKPTGDAANQPNQAKQADQAGPRTDASRTGQESDPANPDNAGEAKPSGDQGVGSDIVGNVVKEESKPKPKTAKDLNEAVKPETVTDRIKRRATELREKEQAQPQEQLKTEPVQETPSRPADYGKSNKVVSQKEADAAKKKLQDFFKGKGGKLYIGLDPEIMVAGLKYSAYHIEAGARKFADFVKVMVEDFGDGIAPYLSGFYEQLKRDPDFKAEGISKEMTSTDDVDNFDIAKFVEELTNNQEDVSDRPGTSQQDQQQGPDEIQGNSESIQSGRGNDRDSGTQNAVGGKKGDQKRPSGTGSRGVSSTTGGKSGIIDLFSNEPGSVGAKTDTGIIDGRGDRIDSTKGNDAEQGGNTDIDPSTQNQVESFASKTAKRLEQQKKAESIPAKERDLDNIRATLPMLLPEQQEDVFKAENRFFDPENQTEEKANGKGYLFTNGTGTGKTYSGLGIAKRFLKMGKENILIITPSQTKVTDWVQDASNLGIKASALDGVSDAGKGVNVTTFAAFRANEAIFSRDFDLIIYDESHRIMESKKGEASNTTTSHFENSNVSKSYALSRLKKSTRLWAQQKELNDQIRKLLVGMNNLDMMDFVYAQRQNEVAALEKKVEAIEAKQKEILPSLEKRAEEAVGKTKVVFLSATPFKSHFNLRYAQNVLFNWGDKETYESASRGQSRVDPESRFFLDNFGSAYEWKYHRLQTKSKANPEAIAMQEIAFNNKLQEQGVLSGRAIESNMDYQRYFPVLAMENGDRFNDAVNRIFDHTTKEFEGLQVAAREAFFSYNYTTQLLESMKASMAIPTIQEHIDLGRKIVIFHRRKQANVAPPFFKILNESRMNAQAILMSPESTAEQKQKAAGVMDQADAFETEFKDILEYEKTLDYRSAIDQLSDAFGERVRFLNGDTPTREKKEQIHTKAFNDDNSNVDILVVQEESGKEGISLHDTSGGKQRMLMSLSLPTSSITALQIEGRVYRIGLESNAIMNYPILGLDFESAHFGTNLNKKLSTTENLAMGDSARDLLNSFAIGIQTAGIIPASEQDGLGGKELDKRIAEERSQFRKAMLVYQSNQKTRGRRDQREGVDFYATPEPIGQKMVEFLGLDAMERALEPSAGKGAIAMWFPGSADRTVIEPSMSLFGKLSSVTGGANQQNMRFEDHNIINKYHGVAMNPPFGSSGKMAMDHVEKALKHLYDGGRVVALIPRGKMDQRLEEFLDSKEGKNFYQRGQILLPTATFDQAGTQVSTRIVIIDKVEKPVNPSDVENIQPFTYDLTRAKTIDELFDSIEDFTVSERIEVQDKKKVMEELTAGEQTNEEPIQTKKPVEIAEKAESGDLKYKEGKHTQTGEILHLVEMTKQLDNYGDLNRLAKSLGGFYDRYSKGFRFKAKEKADEFIQKGTGDSEVRFSIQPTQTKTFTAKNGKEYELKSFPNMVMAFEKGSDKNIGTFTFQESENALDGISIKVAPSHQRNGIGKELVKFAEKTSGKKYKPSSVQSGDFQKFYASISKPTTAAELNQFFSSNRAQELIETPRGPKQTKKAGEIAAKAAEFTKGWNNAPEIITLNSTQEARERFPELEANYSEEDLNDVPAIFINDPQTGKPVTVLIASHSYLSEKGGVERAILHEVIGHYGLREFLKQQANGDKAIYVKAFTDLMEQVFEAKKDTALMADIAKRYFNKPVSELQGNEKLIAADEYIAHLAQSGVQDSWIDRVVAKLRQILRKLGITVGMSDAEIRALIGNSMRIVRGEQGRPVLREGIDTSTLPRKMIIGEQGAQNLDQSQEVTTRIDNLATAREMESANKDPQTIRLATGWERGADGKWRYEVMDVELKINPKSIQTIKKEFQGRGYSYKKATLKDLIEPKNYLFKLYPSAKDIEIVLYDFQTENSPAGQYMPGSEAILGIEFPDTITLWGVDYGVSELTNMQKSTLLHEIQHFIQNEEGFYIGGNQSMFSNNNLPTNPKWLEYIKPENKEKIDRYFEIKKSEQYAKELNESNELFANEFEPKLDELDKKLAEGNYDTYREDGAKIFDDFEQVQKERFPTLYEADQIAKNTIIYDPGEKISAFDAYRRLAGEVEARNVQKRAKMSEEQRRTQTLQSTEDIAREDQIFLSGNQGASMSTTDQTQTPAFKAWFGDSKVVDENGKPLVVYHGTGTDFTVFDKKKAHDKEGRKAGVGYGKNKFYLTTSREIASNWANNSNERGGWAGKIVSGNKYGSGSNPTVMSLFVKIENPISPDSYQNRLEIKLGDISKEYLYGRVPQAIRDKAITELDKELIKEGIDGIYNEENHQIAVFNPTQIKSATGNNGDFNPDNSDIRFMRTGATNADFSAVNTKNYGNAQLSWFERRVIEPLQDRMIRSKKLIQARTDGKVSDKADFYTKENLASGKTLEKARRFEKDLWNPLIQTANQLFNANGISPEEISDYLKFKHHAERKQYFIDEYAKQGKKIPKDDKWPTGMTDQEAADGIADFEAKADPKLVKKLRRQVHKVNQFTTFQRYKSGMITKEVFRDLLTRYKDYVPLTDWKGMEDTNDKVYTLLMSAKGRTSEAADPLPFMFTAAQEAIMRGENNRIRRSVLEFVKENVSPKDYFIRSAYYLNTKSQDEFGNDIWIETMNKPSAAQIQSGEAMRSFNPQIHRHVQQQGELTNVLPVMVEGKRVFIEFKDKEIPSAIKNINQDKLPYILDKWRNFTRWLSSMYTQYSPEFGVRNLIRDVGFGTFNILVEQDATTAAKTMKGMPKSATALGKFFKNNDYPKGKVGEMLKEFMEEGAMTGYTDLQTAADVFAKAKKEIQRADKLNLWQAGGTALVKPIEWAGKGLEIYNKMLENAMRFSYYQTLREAGLSKQKAAAKAKDLTVNFNRKGRASSVMGSLFIFFNASVQGSERLIRSFTNPRTRKKALGLGGTIMAAGLMQSLLYGLSDEEDEDGRTFYEKIPDYTRRNNIILPNFFTEDGNDFLKIPLPYGLNVFHSFGESLGQVLTGKKTIGQESLGMVSAMTNVFSPIGGIELGKDDSDGFYDALSMVLPSVMQPALDLGFNRNFAGRQIYRENFASNQYQLPDSQMYFEGVNPIIREATDFANNLTGGNEVVPGAVDINPEWIEHGINQYLGGPAQFTQNLSNTVINLSKGENVFKDPFLRSTPFVRSFVDKTGTDYQARSEYYENRDNAVSAAEAYDEMLQAGLKEDADQWYKEKQELINLADEFKSYEKDIRSLTKTINELKNEDNERYNDDIQKLLEERTLYMREFNKLYGERIYKKRSNPLKDLIRGN